MNWPVMRAAMADAVATMTNLPLANVVWKGTFEEAQIVIPTRVVLSTSAIRRFGKDETRLVDPTNPIDEEAVLVTGPRGFTWSILIECQNQDPTNPDSTARVLADRVSARLARESVLRILAAADLGVNAIQPIVHRDYLASGRMISWANLDVFMLSVENDIDDSLDSGDWIGDAQINGTVKETDGTTLATVDLDVDARG